jgi:two-component system sensor kinase FixL
LLDADTKDSALAITADVVQMQQVLLNLVRNAIEAIAGADAVVRRVVLTAMPAADGMVEMRVGDSGPGLAADDLDRVFAPFHTTKPDGVGIGLALSRSIVEAYGGRIWASTTPAGAVFHLTMPAA